MNNPVTQASYEVICKDEKCGEHIVFTAPRRQKTKTLQCPQGHRNVYSLKRDPIKHSRSHSSKSQQSIALPNMLTTIIVIVAGLLGAVVGRVLIPFLDWLFMVEIWGWVVVLWIIAWGLLGGSITLRIRNN